MIDLTTFIVSAPERWITPHGFLSVEHFSRRTKALRALISRRKTTPAPAPRKTVTVGEVELEI